jgi:hypothetical protein
MTTASPSQAVVWRSWLRGHRNLTTGLLLMLAAWAWYLPAVRCGFVYYDDVRILRDHPEIYGQTHWSDELRAIFVSGFPRDEPLLLRDVTWALDGRIFGFGNAFGYHLGNVLLHGIVVASMFAFLLGTTRRYGFALAVSAAWLILAIHTEPVFWIMGRKDILSTLFMLLALCAQTRRLTTDSIRARSGWYVAALACFAGGLLSKMSVLSFPLVLLLHALFLAYLNGERPPNGAFPWGSRLVKEILLAAPAFAGGVLVYRWYPAHGINCYQGNYSPHGMTHLWNLLMVDPLSVWVYIQQTFFPWHLKVLYSWPKILPAYPHGQVVASLASVAAAGGIGVWLFCRRKDLFFYYAAFFVIMVPYLGLIVPGILVAERYLYFSAFCLLALAVSMVAGILQRPQPLWRGGAIAVVVAFLALNLFQSFSYRSAWRDGEALWQYHLALPQPPAEAYANLAACYYAQAANQQGTPEMAVSMRKMSVVVDAGLAQFWSNRQQSPPQETYFLFFLQSIVQELQDKPEAALNSLLISDQLRPQFESTVLNLALLYHKLAGLAADSNQRMTCARAARDRYAQYVAILYQGRPIPPEVQRQLADYEAGCAATNHPAEVKLSP